MNRRALLERTVVAIGSGVALAGCSGQTLEETESKPPFLDFDEAELELSYQQAADVVEKGILETAAVEIEDTERFESVLTDHSLVIEEFAVERRIIEEKLEIEREDVDKIESPPYGVGEILELEYEHPEIIGAGMLRSIGLIAGAYARLVAAGLEVELLDAGVLDPDGEAFGSFHVLTSWADEYNHGVTSARRYGSKPWSTASTV